MSPNVITEQSLDGRCYVITASRALYEIDLDSYRPSVIIRFRARKDDVLLPRELLTGIGTLRFDVPTGDRVVCWWKTHPEDRGIPGAAYVGTVRRTSRVRLIVREGPEQVSIPLAALPTEWPEEIVRRILNDAAGPLLDRLRYVLMHSDRTSFEEFLSAMAHWVDSEEGR